MDFITSRRSEDNGEGRYREGDKSWKMETFEEKEGGVEVAAVEGLVLALRGGGRFMFSEFVTVLGADGEVACTCGGHGAEHCLGSGGVRFALYDEFLVTRIESHHGRAVDPDEFLSRVEICVLGRVREVVDRTHTAVEFVHNVSTFKVHSVHLKSFSTGPDDHTKLRLCFCGDGEGGGEGGRFWYKHPTFLLRRSSLHLEAIHSGTRMESERPEAHWHFSHAACSATLRRMLLWAGLPWSFPPDSERAWSDPVHGVALVMAQSLSVSGL